MAKPNPPAGSLITPSADEQPSLLPHQVGPRPSAIASAPASDGDDPAVEVPDVATVKCLVTHGTLRHGGQSHPPDSIVALPPDEARFLVGQGVVRILAKAVVG